MALELGCSGNFVKDKAHIGVTTDLPNTWALKTPLPDDYVEYINLIRQTSHQLKGITAFNSMVKRGQHYSKLEKSDDRQTSSKRQRKDRKGPGLL